MAEPGLGDVAFFGVGQESAWATAANRTAFFRLISETLKLNGGFNYPITGTFGHEQRWAVKLPTFVDGSVELEANYEGLGWLLKNLLGTVGTAQIASSLAYTHTFTPSTALPFGLSGEVDRDKGAFPYTGLKINQATFSQEKNEPLSATFDFIGKAESDTAAATAETFPSTKLILADHFSMELNDTAVLITDWNLTINNGLSGGERSDLGSLTIKEPVRVNKQVITGGFTAEFDDTTVYAKWNARTSTKLELLYAGDTVLFTADSDQVYGLQFIMPTIYFQAGELPVSSMGPIIQTYAFQAVYDVDSDTHAISMVLVNTDTTYTDT